MPFKLFGSTKKAKKDKSASTNAVDLAADQTSDEPPDCEVKPSTKSKLHFFSIKGNNHVHFKDADGKDKKVKRSMSLGNDKKTKSLMHIPSNTNEDAAVVNSAEQCSKNQRSGKPQGRTKRSASYGTVMDSFTRERRLLEIVQLDNYIERLRHTEDEGHLTNRMCCAQFLKLGLIRIEMAHRHSLERLDRVPPVNGASQQLKNQTNHSKNKQADESDVGSNNSDGRKDDSGSDAAFSNDTESDSRDSEHDSGSDHEQGTSCRVQESRSHLTFGTKSKTTPVWPRDIEIF